MLVGAHRLGAVQGVLGRLVRVARDLVGRLLAVLLLESIRSSEAVAFFLLANLGVKLVCYACLVMHVR